MTISGIPDILGESLPLQLHTVWRRPSGGESPFHILGRLFFASQYITPYTGCPYIADLEKTRGRGSDSFGFDTDTNAGDTALSPQTPKASAMGYHSKREVRLSVQVSERWDNGETPRQRIEEARRDSAKPDQYPPNRVRAGTLAR